jgi:5'-3' exonuclease
VYRGGQVTESTLLAVDGNSLAHRAFHGYIKTDLRTKSGGPLWAVYGFLALLAGVCEKTRPTSVVVGFDDHTVSLRKNRCPEYKAQRVTKDSELYEQLDIIMSVLNEIGIPVVVPSGLEADDVVASAAASAERSGSSCVVATSDRDSFSLITELTTVLKLGSGLDNAVRFTPDVLMAKYGVRPEQYLDYAALRGDSSDNLVGVRGVGERTAAKLLAEFGSVDHALSEPDLLAACVGKSLSARVTSDEGRESIDRNRDIMNLVRDVAIDLDAARLPIDRGRVELVLGRWELEKLVPRLVEQLCHTAGEAGDTDSTAAFEEVSCSGETPDLGLWILEAENADTEITGAPVSPFVAAWEDTELF